jgi:tyrosine-protein kinase Etk/Wzc
VLSLARQETLLVRANLRSAPPRDGPGAGPGLAEVLAGKATLDDAVRVDPSSTLMTLEAGAAGADDPDHLLQPENLEAFFDEARRLFREIVVDAPPLLPHLDDLVLARFADRILICVQPRVTDLAALRDAVAQLRQAGGPVTGAVVVGS